MAKKITNLSAAAPSEEEKRAEKQAAKIDKLQAELRSAKQERDLAVSRLEEARSAPKVRAPKVKAPRKRTRKDVVRVCVPDTHGSIADEAALAAFFGDLKRLDPDEIILLGDHVDCGGFLSSHGCLYVADMEYSYEEDIAAANAFLDRIQSIAPRAKIDYLEGNHEFRVERWATDQHVRHGKDAELLRRLVSPHTLLRLEERGIRYYRQSELHDGLRVPGWIQRGKCFFTHGISTAKHAASMTLNQAAGNIVYGHTHRCDQATARYPGIGSVSAWSPGCLCELQPRWRHSSPTNWTHGYGVQLVAPSERFLHINVPIIDGASLLGPMFAL